MLPNPWLILGGIVLAFALCVGSYMKGNRDGRAATRTAWAESDNRALRDANAQILTMQIAARAKEQEQAKQLSAVSTIYQRNLADAKRQRDRDVAAARAGALQLRDPGAAGQCAGAGGAAQAPAGPGGGDGPARADVPKAPAGVLSSDAAEFLIALVNEADESVLQLLACQAVVRADRE